MRAVCCVRAEGVAFFDAIFDRRLGKTNGVRREGRRIRDRSKCFRERSKSSVGTSEPPIDV